jgi:hypothetical protein
MFKRMDSDRQKRHVSILFWKGGNKPTLQATLGKDWVSLGSVLGLHTILDGVANDCDLYYTCRVQIKKTIWMNAVYLLCTDWRQLSKTRSTFKEAEDHRCAEFTFTICDNYKGYLLWGKVSFVIKLIEFGDSILLLYVANPQRTVKYRISKLND